MFYNFLVYFSGEIFFIELGLNGTFSKWQYKNDREGKSRRLSFPPAGYVTLHFSIYPMCMCSVSCAKNIQYCSGDDGADGDDCIQ